tara:strand:- start:5664 stop:6257 length:594 start_codon:yes stop_codon:yes gene_type:complete
MTRIPLLLTLSLTPLLGSHVPPFQDEVPQPTAEAFDLEALAWLSGHWHQAGESQDNVEIWTNSDGGLFLGMNKAVDKKRDRASFEYLRIVRQADGTIDYIAQPGGKDPVAFRLVELSPGKVVFTNPDHDFPQRIAYSREKDVLAAAVGTLDQHDMLAFRWTLVRPEPVATPTPGPKGDNVLPSDVDRDPGPAKGGEH